MILLIMIILINIVNLKIKKLNSMRYQAKLMKSFANNIHQRCRFKRLYNLTNDIQLPNPHPTKFKSGIEKLLKTQFY